MIMTSEQVKELRSAAEMHKNNSRHMVNLLNSAANTIETLSAKLSTANMERLEAYYGGGWIACKDRLPEVEQDVLLSFRSLDVRVGYRANTDGYFYVYGEEYVAFENTLAWMPLPEGYHEQK